MSDALEHDPQMIQFDLHVWTQSVGQVGMKNRNLSFSYTVYKSPLTNHLSEVIEVPDRCPVSGNLQSMGRA